MDRAFDVLSEMRAETQPIDPDHITVGALMKACASGGQVSLTIIQYLFEAIICLILDPHLVLSVETIETVKLF